ncbi:azurin [Vibrio sagamiensis]|uniref:Azurin n=1 Tax=Vibrio sagamiensis NBRC 104589 TaxID=1219064 RepID=A0A511QH19_9VIBR|nr:azurin [Vibrio sagamiensis]PNQ53742.1 azurin [Vibrio agarivorans]GEM76588.1 azurin [Vibrio sagamiensis NBRC 104589]
MPLRTILAITFWGVSLNVQANADCEISIDANDIMQFSSKILSVPVSCKEVKLTLNHTGKMPAQSMGHNIVITDSENVQAVGTDGMSAGFENNYLKPADDRVYASTKVIGGGESTSVIFNTEKMSPVGDYTFFCSFPGHWAIMQGKFELTS